jgi:type IV secretory pathway VirB2 component (pilin)
VADQAASGTMAEAAGNTGAHGLDVQTGLPHIQASHHGRPASWVAVTIIVVGFVVGGIALPVGPTWWLFWTGTAIVVIGAIFAASIRVFDDWY